MNTVDNNRIIKLRRIDIFGNIVETLDISVKYLIKLIPVGIMMSDWIISKEDADIIEKAIKER